MMLRLVVCILMVAFCVWQGFLAASIPTENGDYYFPGAYSFAIGFLVTGCNKFGIIGWPIATFILLLRGHFIVGWIPLALVVFNLAGNYLIDRKTGRQPAEPSDAQAQCDLGTAYYNDNDYPEALRWFEKAAEKGHVEAQTMVGAMYHCGEGVTCDYAKAIKWYLLAAEQNDARAQFNLGRMYETGEGVTRDWPEAMKWYRKAAELGLTCAQFNIGNMYEKRKGVSFNSDEARKWYEKAGERGDLDAQMRLGYMYYEGDGVRRDNVKAYKWFSRAAAQNFDDDENKPAKTLIDPILQMIDSELTPKQREQVQKFVPK